MKQIELTQGKFALVDNEDFEELSQYNWCFDGRYALRSKKISGTRKSYAIYMHRAILGLSRKKDSGLEVDHISGSQLDNQKKNLRICTHQQNRANSKLQTNNTSGYKGVMFDNDPRKRIRRWKVEMKVKGKKIHIGRFLTREEAAKAYNKAAIRYYGEFAKLNQL